MPITADLAAPRSPIKELRELRRWARDRLLGHPFFEVLADGSHTQAAIRLWAMQDYYISREFPRLVAAIAARISEPRLRHVIVVNLWEEHGDGNFDRAHSNLFDRLLESMSIDPAHLAPPSSPTSEFIDLQIGLAEDNVLAGLGAFCYGNEYLTLSEFRPVEKACVRAYPKADLSYFISNRQADGRHARDAENVIVELCHGPMDLKNVQRGAEAAVDGRLNFYDDLLKQLGSAS